MQSQLLKQRWSLPLPLSLLFAVCMASSTYAAAVATTADVAAAGLGVTTQNVLLAAKELVGKQTLSTSSAGGAAVCPRMLRHVFDNATPRDDQKAGIYVEYKPPAATVDMLDEEAYLWNCLEACCEKSQNQTSTCNVVLVFKRKCYHIRCASNEACLPKQRVRDNDKVQMLLVNPVGNADVSWAKLLKETKQNPEILPVDELAGAQNVFNFRKKLRPMQYLARSQDSQAYDEDDFPIAEKRMKQLLMQPDDTDVLSPDDINYYGGAELPTAKFMACDIENPCPPQEECVPLQANAFTGICRCLHGFLRNKQQKCVMQAQALSAFLGNELTPQEPLVAAASDIVPAVTELPSKVEQNKNILVSVMSKEVRLPEQEVTLSAFTVPEEQPGDTKYKYLWTLITQPKGPMNGTMSDQSKSKVKLSNLSEGLYTFKVTVTGDNGTFGEAQANVTVLPEKRINQPPQVIISPKMQIIRQPISNAVLDGSYSTDDDKITNWHWELTSGPIGYQPQLPEVNMLQLTDLNSPGNYTFKLTVTDSNNATNSTTATISVLKETDYAPVANAGDAVIIYLPNNNVTLNGTASTDDHEIVAWEWTKDTNDEAKAVDMQSTRTPYLQLSNLEEGMYTFVLKVTDGSGQSSIAKVNVFVKPPTNSPPVAVAGANVTTSLPINWVLLNGSESKDDIGIKSYQWTQLIGPNKAVILKSNASIANATGLTLGLYQFGLNVTDENNNTAMDTTWVKIVQERNAPPVANAGGDQTVTLPVSTIHLNGTQSSDDLAVVKYVWTREGASLAAGVVVDNTDKQPVMILTNLVHGRYVFKLTVSDDQGLTSSDTVSINVHADPLQLHLVQITLPRGITALTKSELDSIVQKLELLLGDNHKIQIRELTHDLHTDAAVLVFYVAVGEEAKPLNGLHVERLLRAKLLRDASILGALFVDIRTKVCQNNCSNHGSCNAITRACLCEAFWMPTAGYYLGSDEANCDWSILYVFICVIAVCLLLAGMFWSIACACRQSKKPRSRQKVQKYALIGAQDEETANHSRNTSLTESETDSDVLFETRTKPNGRHKGHNSSHGSSSSAGQRNKKYQVTRLGRKIKT